MGVQIHFGILVPQGDGVIVMYFCGNSSASLIFTAIRALRTFAVEQHLISSQRLLEGGAHEGVAGAGLREQRKVDVEERKVENEWQQDKADGARAEVLPEIVLVQKHISDRGARDGEPGKRTIECPSLLWSRTSHKSIRTAKPIVATVRMPFTFEPHVHAMNVPVRKSHVHHSGVNSLQGGEQWPRQQQRTRTCSEAF